MENWGRIRARKSGSGGKRKQKGKRGIGFNDARVSAEGSDLGLELPKAIGLINRAPRATMGGLSSNELMFGMVLEEDQNAHEGL